MSLIEVRDKVRKGVPCGGPFVWGPLFGQTCWTCLNPPLPTRRATKNKTLPVFRRNCRPRFWDLGIQTRAAHRSPTDPCPVRSSPVATTSDGCSASLRRLEAPRAQIWNHHDSTHWWPIIVVVVVVVVFEVTKRISTKLGHIFTYDCCLKNLVQTHPVINPPRAGAKYRFLAQTVNFDRIYLCKETCYQ